ncbi:hypothetical protein Pcinc_034865 [Petrolisthes cinctipes]|uniref:Reverse transcriptase n=1 Tax=Petrolisthes cinctipes TaxID=88211 RepID=A0AAE1EPN3_PETCI|nr:hypothetical protein Pcinc_034865 [Petrolisthes cinctipes]
MEIDFDEVLDDIHIDEQTVKQKLEGLETEKSPGPDGISARMLKELKSQICRVLVDLYMTSLTEGRLPQDWKTANVSAIYKKGDKTNVGNYRPVSLTCIICKILESIIRCTNFIRNS